MTKRIATPANISSVWADAVANDTIVLRGRFVNWRPVNRSFASPVFIDASQAEMIDFYGVNLEGVTIIGGRWSPSSGNKMGLRVDRARRVTIIGAEAIGADRNWGVGISLMGEDNWIEDCTARNLRTGMSILGHRTKIVQSTFRAMGSDGLNLFGAQDFVVHGVDAADFDPIPGAHPDVVQLASLPAKLKTRNIAISDVRARGAVQGVTAFNHPSQGQQGFENLTIENCDLQLSWAHGIAVYDGVGVTVRNNRVSTVPGSQHQCTINLIRCSEVKRKGNSIAAYVTKGVDRTGRTTFVRRAAISD